MDLPKIERKATAQNRGAHALSNVPAKCFDRSFGAKNQQVFSKKERMLSACCQINACEASSVPPVYYLEVTN